MDSGLPKCCLTSNKKCVCEPKEIAETFTDYFESYYNDHFNINMKKISVILPFIDNLVVY